MMYINIYLLMNTKILMLTCVNIIINVLYKYIEPYNSCEIYCQDIWLWQLSILSLAFICFITLIFDNVSIIFKTVILFMLYWYIIECWSVINFIDTFCAYENDNLYTMNLPILFLSMIYIILITKN